MVLSTYLLLVQNHAIGFKLSTLGNSVLNRSEVWHFYEERFGNLSEMPHSDYKLITAANMKPKGTKNRRGKKIKLSLEDACDGCTKIIET